MQVITLCILLVVQLLPAAAEQRTFVSQYGITWTFDRSYECGRYITGDWWVKGPVTVRSVTPGWNGSGNGSMVNPVPGNKQGFDARNTDKYSASLRKSFPLPLQAGQSLISSVQKPDYTGSWSALKGAAILTCVSTTPAADAFRPQYCSGSKLSFTAGQINYAAIPKVTPPAILVPAGSEIIRKVQRPWIDFDGGWEGTLIHPADNMPAYGCAMSLDVSDVALYCLLDRPERTQAITGLIQLGIDNYGVLKAGGGWPADGGHASGRKWPILFAGIALGHTGMRGIGSTYGDISFGEDCQTYYKNGQPAWGIRHCQGNDLVNNYRISSTSHSWVGQMLACLMMGAKSLWNHNAYFDYVDAWIAEKPTGPFVTYFGTRFSQIMWITYRNNLPGPAGISSDIPGRMSAGDGSLPAGTQERIFSIDGIKASPAGRNGVYLVRTPAGWEKRVIIR